MRTVEGEIYKPPKDYGTLAHSRKFGDNLTKPGYFNDLPQLAQELGFVRVANVPTKRATWQVYNRLNQKIPNFPEGFTKVNSTLALYDTGEELAYALLRTSPEPYQPDEFNKDLAAFTKHYAERPRWLGFPSQKLTGNYKNLIMALVGGTLAMSVLDYYAIHSTGNLINLGSIFGELGSPAIYGALWRFSESHARRSISNPEQYTAEQAARSTLSLEQYHTVTVDVQRELYQALQQEGVQLTPNQFLDKIYRQIPPELISQRYGEIKQTMYPQIGSPQKASSSLPKLVEASHILQTADSYYTQANELMQRLGLL